MLIISDLLNDLPKAGSISKVSGKVSAIKGQTILAKLPHASLGDICSIECGNYQTINAQVVSFNENNVVLAPFSEIRGISPGSRIISYENEFNIKIPDVTGGLIIDALGNVLQNKTSHSAVSISLDLFREAPQPLSRKPVVQQLVSGIKSIDTICPIGYGQRLGLFAAAGLGKSTLLGMLARNADVDINVIALTGERGREVGEFINEVIGEEGLKKSILVVATSDKPAMQRSLASITATAIAEHHRSQGKKVLLLIDSLTRTARAIRDVSLAAGEIPIRQGLTASVYNELPKLIERAGNDDKGSITAIYTLLDSSEFEPDPLAEEVKSLLDGHICLDNRMLARGVRPAINITRSISRCISNIFTQEQLAARDCIVQILNKIEKEKDMILMGGTPDEDLKACLKLESDIINFLSQDILSKSAKKQSFAEIARIVSLYRSRVRS